MCVDPVCKSASATNRVKGYTRLLALKVRDIIKLVERDGWRLIGQQGSHRQYRHLTRPGKVTIAGHPADDVAPGTLNSIRKQAGLKK